MNFKLLFLAAALSTSAGVSNAAPGDPVALTLLPSGTGTLSASFVQGVDGAAAMDGFVSDTFNFTPTYFGGPVSVALTSLTGQVAFSVVQLNDQFFSNLSSDLFAFSFQTLVTADQPLTLTVLRDVEDAQGNLLSGSGSYNLSVTAGVAAAVPEPRTWALLLGGLLAVALVNKAAGPRREVRRRTV